MTIADDTILLIAVTVLLAGPTLGWGLPIAAKALQTRWRTRRDIARHRQPTKGRAS